MLALVTHARPGWSEGALDLPPGAHVVLLSVNADVGIEGRLLGWELRDTLLILSVGPSSSYAFLFRVPITLGTIAEQVMASATGGLNIDACRVSTVENLNGGRYSDGKDESDGPTYGKGLNRRSVHSYEQPLGRWPSNLVFVHGPGCMKVGTKQVSSTRPITQRSKPAGFHPTNRVFGTGTGEFHSTGYADEDGLETVAAYDCEPRCPVRLLDAQAGVLTSGVGAKKNATSIGHQANAFGVESRPAGTEMISYGDSGGASRFYPQFRDEDELWGWLERLITPGSTHLRQAEPPGRSPR